MRNERFEYRGLTVEFYPQTWTVELSNDLGENLSLEDMDRMKELAAWLLHLIEKYEEE